MGFQNIKQTFVFSESCEERDFNYAGNDAGAICASTTNTWKECSVVCGEDAACTHWTWYSDTYAQSGDRKKCCKKTSAGGKAAAPGAISGAKDCGKGKSLIISHRYPPYR